MNYLIKSRSWTFMLVAMVMLVLTACDVVVASHFISPEMIGVAAAIPFMMGDTANVGEIADLLKRQGDAFNEFKNANDARIKAIEEKGYAPADIVEKVEKINNDLNQLGRDIQEVAKKSNRPQVMDTKGVIITPEQAEYKAAFGDFIRNGKDAGLKELERKAFQRGSDVQGGYLIHSEMDAAIDRIAATVSTMRDISDVITIGKASHEKRVKTSGLSGRWVGEGEAGGETANPQYAKVEITAEEIEIEPWAYNTALEDADMDVEADIMNEAGIGFGETEGDGFVNGNGVKKPRGILSYTTVANASYAWGKVGFIKSGANGAFAASNPGDKVIDLIHSLKSTYRNGAVMVMADTTLGSLRQIKDGSGSFYLFNPDPLGNFSGFVLGVPVIVDDNMPILATDSLSIAYGNFKRGYRIVDRKGISLIRDSLTTKGTTKFNMRKRVGGGIIQFEAIKLMKFAA